MKIGLSLVGILALTCLNSLVRAAPEVGPSTAPAEPLTKTVGVDIVKMTDNPDQTRTLLFRWKDKNGKDVERSVILTRDTVIGIDGQLKTMADLTDVVIHRNKAVATVGPDMVTAVSLRVGRAMIKMTKDQLTPGQIAALEAAAPRATAASDAAMAQRVNEIVDSLQLSDPSKAARVKTIVTTHLRNVRDSHNAGFAPERASHENFSKGLALELTPEQIETVKDRITVNKVPVTFRAYHEIVPGLTAEEDRRILEVLKQAREESLDVKNPDEMSVVFNIYKTQIENYLIANGHDWKKLYKAFTDAQRAGRNPSATRPAATN
jgi:hypothetical protein